MTRYDLPAFFRDQGFKSGAEIGVRRGTFSFLLCQTIPDLHLLCVDPWKRYKTSPVMPSQARQEENLKITIALLRPYNAQIIRLMSMEAVKSVPDQSLDFVYIDAHHGYEFVSEDIREWSKKVRDGGIVSGDDYSPSAPGVTKAVDEYVSVHSIKLHLTDDNGKASWYWFKNQNENRLI